MSSLPTMLIGRLGCRSKHSFWFCEGMVCSIILLFGMLILVFLSILIFNWKMTKGEYWKIRYMSLLHNLIIYGNSWNYVQALKDHLSHCKICELKQSFISHWTQKSGKLFRCSKATSRLISFFFWYVISLVFDVICNLKQLNFHSSHFRDGHHDVHLLLRICGHLPGPHLQVGQLPCRDRRTRPLTPSNKDDNCNFLLNRQLSPHSTKEGEHLVRFAHQFLDDKVV